MMGLAPVLGRNAAHDVVYDACKRVTEDGKLTLYEELASRPEITAQLSLSSLQKLCDPENYLGASQLMVDEVLACPTRRRVEKRANGHTNGH